MGRTTIWICFVYVLCTAVVSCVTQPDSESENFNDSVVATFAVNLPSPQLPEWAKQAAMYEVNIRQYTPEGTFNAFAKHLPRLKDMGVDILCLIPVFPISRTKRKGSLGSYYAVSDFRKVNPEFGTLQDFDALVQQIHALGMHVILDWAPNHTGWDHRWIKEHPEWYVRDELADTIVHPQNIENTLIDLSDVAELNYDQPEMVEAMMANLRYWITEREIDGYHFDEAGSVPDEFWKTCSQELKAIKPVFLLSTSDIPAYRNSGYFQMDYGWDFYRLMEDIAKGRKNAMDINIYFRRNLVRYKQGSSLLFTSNFVENSSNGSVIQRMKKGHQAFAVMTTTIDGMPLIYSGQEEPNGKKLELYEKDAIDFNDYAYHDFYKKLLNLKKSNKALSNGPAGGQLIHLATGRDDSVIAYLREKGDQKILVIINLSEFQQSVSLTDKRCVGNYNNVFANSSMIVPEEFTLSLGPWDYLVLAK